MSKPVKCLVVNPTTCPKPYTVRIDEYKVHVIEFVGDDIMIGAYSDVDKDHMLTDEYLQILLNQAYKRGVDDATRIIADKMLDGMLDNLGVC